MTPALKEVLKKSKVTVLAEDYSLIEVGKEDFELSEGIEKSEFLAMISCGGKSTFVIPTKFANDLDGENMERIDGWKVLSMGVELPTELVGYIAEITAVLARAEVNLLYISSFRTDHFLVKMEELEKAVAVLDKLILEAGK